MTLHGTESKMAAVAIIAACTVYGLALMAATLPFLYTTRNMLGIQQMSGLLSATKNYLMSGEFIDPNESNGIIKIWKYTISDQDISLSNTATANLHSVRFRGEWNDITSDEYERKEEKENDGSGKTELWQRIEYLMHLAPFLDSDEKQFEIQILPDTPDDDSPIKKQRLFIRQLFVRVEDHTNLFASITATHIYERMQTPPQQTTTTTTQSRRQHESLDDSAAALHETDSEQLVLRSVQFSPTNLYFFETHGQGHGHGNENKRHSGPPSLDTIPKMLQQNRGWTATILTWLRAIGSSSSSSSSATQNSEQHNGDHIEL